MSMLDLLKVLPLYFMEIVDVLDRSYILDNLQMEDVYNLRVVSISPSKSRKKVKVTVDIGNIL